MEKKNKNSSSELIGFKEFIEYEDKKRPPNNIKTGSDNFDLLSFLEHESIRLSKTIDLCEDQTYSIKKHPQADFILEQQTDLVNKNQSIIIELLRRKDSPLTSNLKELLSLHFSN